jgi:sugar lactone lactonase YvrE
MAADGTVYWSGYNVGDVGRLSPDGHSRTLVNIGKGVNPVVIGPDGALYASRFSYGNGFYRIDPATAEVEELNPDVAVNAFAFGPDGAVFAPTMSPLPSHLIRLDTTTWQPKVIDQSIGLVGASVRFPPTARHEAPTTAYVLSAALPAVVQRIEVTTGRKAAPDIRLPFLLSDNMAFAPDGTLFVTGFVPATVAVVDVNGRVHTVKIGRS